MSNYRTTKDYHVEWHIDITARNQQEAAQIALNIQRDPESFATFFEVTDKGSGVRVTVDVGDGEVCG